MQAGILAILLSGCSSPPLDGLPDEVPPILGLEIKPEFGDPTALFEEGLQMTAVIHTRYGGRLVAGIEASEGVQLAGAFNYEAQAMEGTDVHLQATATAANEGTYRLRLWVELHHEGGRDAEVREYELGGSAESAELREVRESQVDVLVQLFAASNDPYKVTLQIESPVSMDVQLLLRSEFRIDGQPAETMRLSSGIPVELHLQVVRGAQRDGVYELEATVVPPAALDARQYYSSLFYTLEGNQTSVSANPPR